MTVTTQSGVDKKDRDSPRKGISRTLSVRGAFDPQHKLHRVTLAEGLKHLTPSSGNLPLLVLAGGASEEQRKKMCHRRVIKDLGCLSGWCNLAIAPHSGLEVLKGKPSLSSIATFYPSHFTCIEEWHFHLWQQQDGSPKTLCKTAFCARWGLFQQPRGR